MADARDLKSRGSDPVPVRSRSPAPYRGIEQLVARRAHNPEVGGSSPPPATNKPLKSYDFSGFLHFSLLFCPVYFFACCLTHTLTHVGTSSGSLPSPPAARLAPSAAPPFQMRPAALGSHLVLPPSQHSRHSLGCLTLSGAGHMGVGIEGEPRREVTQHTGHRLDVHSILQGQGGEGVP